MIYVLYQVFLKIAWDTFKALSVPVHFCFFYRKITTSMSWKIFHCIAEIFFFLRTLLNYLNHNEASVCVPLFNAVFFSCFCRCIGMEIFQNYSFATCFPPQSTFLFPLKIERRNRHRQSSDGSLAVRAINPLFLRAIFFQACFGNANNFTSSFSQNTNDPELVKELN